VTGQLSSEASGSAQSVERFTRLCRELSLPLAAARLKLLVLRGGSSNPGNGIRAVLQAVTDAETMMVTVVALCSGLAPELIRNSIDLGAMIAHTLATLPRQEGSSQIRVKLPDPLVGQWNFWLCRRLVRELVTFPVAISDRVPAVSAFRTSEGAVLSVHLEGADLMSPEGQTLQHELGLSPRQFHLWLAAQLAEAHGGGLRVTCNDQGWVGLTATLPERSPPGDGPGARRRPAVSSAQRRALIHMLRSPLSAARLRLRFVQVDPAKSGALAEIERHLTTSDGAIARLLPLTGGLADLEPMPGDLAAILAAAVRADAPAATFRTVGPMPGRWDRYAVECIVRNLLTLAGARPLHPAVFSLEPSDGGALLSVSCSVGRPNADAASRWLIQQLAAAHGGWSTCSTGPDPFTAQVFLRGGDPTR
jgi:hypothetical protein